MAGERGRPRSFERETVLDNALKVFWEHGFQSTSLADLTAATGLNKPSLYAAFGDKEALYLQALERYVHSEIAQRLQLLDAHEDARTALAVFLRSMAALFTDAQQPGGCFIINGTADQGGTTMPAQIETALQQALQAGEEKLRERLRRAQRAGQLGADVKPADLASVFATLLAGMAVLAKSGARRARLNAVIATALQGWPGR